MNDLNDKYLNVTLRNSNEEHEEEKISISIVGILKNLRRFFALWISLSIIVSILALIGTSLVKQDSYKKMVSLVSFSYSGIEKGLDPKGNEFNINSVKSPQIIETALSELNLEPKLLEDVRKNISFRGIKPKEAAEKITAYKGIYEAGTSNSLNAVEQILNTKVNPTTYEVFFDYAPTGLTNTQAATLLNTILECYSEYFIEAYGYNKSLGNSLSTIDYKNYDYAEAIDVFDDTLSKLSNYISQISSTDSTHFRSSDTGYSFADISENISTLRSIDLDRISSYVSLNTITKDKDKLLTYYTYRVEALERHKAVCNETLASVKASIDNYTKNTVMIFGANGSDNMNITASESSEEYDRLFEQKQSIQDDLSKTIQAINRYNQRIERLSSSTSVNSSVKRAKVEEELSLLYKHTDELVDLVNRTTEDFYKTVVFSKSYNILVPANSSYSNTTKNVIKDALIPVVAADALIFLIYFAVSVILSCIEEYNKSREDEEKEIQEPAETV